MEEEITIPEYNSTATPHDSFMESSSQTAQEKLK